MIFYAFICWAPREVLKLEPERREFQHLPRGPAECMFNRYYCIKTFFRSKTLEKLLQKVLFSVPIMARKSTLPTNVLKTPISGQRLTSSLLVYTLLKMMLIL